MLQLEDELLVQRVVVLGPKEARGGAAAAVTMGPSREIR
jgi:hypothetical protein